MHIVSLSVLRCGLHDEIAGESTLVAHYISGSLLGVRIEGKKCSTSSVVESFAEDEFLWAFVSYEGTGAEHKEATKPNLPIGGMWDVGKPKALS